MTFFHFVNCVTLAYAPYFIAYKYSGLNEYSSFWRCAQASGGYFLTQLIKLLLLATFFPAADADGFAVLPELLKSSADVVDVIGMHLIMTHLLNGKGEVRFLVGGLGWGAAHSVASSFVLFWVGARMLFSVLHIRGWLMVLARFAFSSAIATGTFLAYTLAGKNMEPDLGPIPQTVEDYVIPDESSLLGPCEGVQIEPSSEFVTPLSPTKRFGARIAEDSMIPPESPDMKFARDRLGTLLTSIRQGEAPWLNPLDKKQTTETNEFRRGPGRPKKDLLVMRDIVALPRARSPYPEPNQWPDKDSIDRFDASVDPQNIDALRDEYARHWKQVKNGHSGSHSLAEEKRMPKQRTCPECGKLMLKRNLFTHLKVVHRKNSGEVSEIREQINRETGLARVTCPLCKEIFTTYEGLARHCQASHSEDGAAGRPQDYSMFLARFSSREDYEHWPCEEVEEICEETCTSLSKDHTQTFTHSTTLRFSCNRAGVHQPTPTKSTRRGCLGHVGHELDPALLRLSNQQTMYLKKLLEEHTMDDIIDRLRKEDPTRTSKLSSLRKSDLRNFARKYNMVPLLGKNDDAFSLRSNGGDNDSNDGTESLEVAEDSREDGCETSEKERTVSLPIDLKLDISTTTAQERLEARYHKLRAIKYTSAMVEAAASALVDLDTDEAMEQLEEILIYLQSAARVSQPTPPDTLPVVQGCIKLEPS
ncbi:hypothetical protein GCK32_003671 [Trichostrongylus colubriformis]|uniref:BOS complex subunit TMEM147 n=1 Tax=Trichostrongylus colubriformis TaxID=6319 RepID=A0AAN8EQH0_TRICO